MASGRPLIVRTSSDRLHPELPRSARSLAVRRVSVKVEPVDPRDTQWEVDHPVYRVYFWNQQPAPPGISQEHMAFESHSYRVLGARDVHEVTEWATKTARANQTFCLYIEQLHGDSPGLIHLFGDDPTVAN